MINSCSSTYLPKNQHKAKEKMWRLDQTINRHLDPTMLMFKQSKIWRAERLTWCRFSKQNSCDRVLMPALALINWQSAFITASMFCPFGSFFITFYCLLTTEMSTSAGSSSTRPALTMEFKNSNHDPSRFRFALNSPTFGHGEQQISMS